MKGSKAKRRARKKANRALRPLVPRCDRCGRHAPSKDGNHDTALSVGRICWDGLVVVAWCVACGCDTCS